mmetsp:Transcript_6613/g.18532  ORF Transcript_6613/g.18532 Transcript_6613/m.18532 type:complete len:213 (-) Transcript_6613:877-1515(-)
MSPTSTTSSNRSSSAKSQTLSSFSATTGRQHSTTTSLASFAARCMDISSKAGTSSRAARSARSWTSSSSRTGEAATWPRFTLGVPSWLAPAATRCPASSSDPCSAAWSTFCSHTPRFWRCTGSRPTQPPREHATSPQREDLFICNCHSSARQTSFSIVACWRWCDSLARNLQVVTWFGIALDCKPASVSTMTVFLFQIEWCETQGTKGTRTP